jgi:hypothetical protein
MKKIKLTRGRCALVDDQDFEYLNQWKWFYGNHGYAQRRLGKRGRMLGMHRVIMGEPKGFLVDHIDGDGLNNCRSNLRVATHAQNLCNRGKNSNNTSGFKGVNWHKNAKKWAAAIMVNRRSHHLGLFSDVQEAAKAYDIAALELHGEFARLNDA